MVKVRDYIIRATELTALSVWRLIQDKGFTLGDLLTEEESKAREKLVDQTGVDAMYASLTDIPFVLEVVGSEGRKHIHQYGEALPTLEGTFGTGDLVAGKKVDCLVSISAITDDNKWFDLDGVKELEGGRQVTTLTVDSNGVNINTKIHH